MASIAAAHAYREVVLLKYAEHGKRFGGNVAHLKAGDDAFPTGTFDRALLVSATRPLDISHECLEH